MATGEKKRISLRVLGPFELERDGQRLDLRSKKARGLLAYLALRPGMRDSRDRLAALLWGDMGEDRARHNLRQCVSSLRKLLGDDVLLGDAHDLQLSGEAIEVDALALERAEGEAVAAAYRGELLEGLSLREAPFEEWLTVERARLRNAVLDRLRARLRRESQRGANEKAIAAARDWLAVDPASEAAHRALMRLYAGSGRRSAALRQYEACIESLRTLLDARPSVETERLARELRESGPEGELEAPIGGGPVAWSDKPSIAVLPFSQASQPEGHYFASGIAEDIAIALSRFESLFVISPLATRELPETERSPRQVSDALDAQYVAAGRALRAGKRIRISVQLVHGATGTAVWAHRYDRSADEIFAVLDEITETIVATLVSRVEAAGLSRAKRKPTASLAAYECLLRGKDYHHRWTREDNARAIEMFERAIELDPEYALPHAWLACALGQRHVFVPDPGWIERAIVLVRTAHALDDGESECYRMFAAYYLARRQFDKAAHHQARAMELNPNDDRIVCQMGEIATALGRAGEGVRWVRRAMRLNPYHRDTYWAVLGEAQFHSGAPRQALDSLRRLGRPSARNLAYLAASAALAGLEEAARDYLERIEGETGRRVARLVRSAPLARQRDRRVLAEALASLGVREAD